MSGDRPLTSPNRAQQKCYPVFCGIPLSVRKFSHGLSVHVIATLSEPLIHNASAPGELSLNIVDLPYRCSCAETRETAVSVRTRRRAISVPRRVAVPVRHQTLFDNSPLRVTGVTLGAKAWAMAATRATRRTVSRAIFFSMGG